MARAQVIETVRGKSGGIRMLKNPAEIWLGWIVRASEGNSPIVECLSGEPGECRITTDCRLALFRMRSFDALYQTLEEY